MQNHKTTAAAAMGGQTAVGSNACRGTGEVAMPGKLNEENRLENTDMKSKMDISTRYIIRCAYVHESSPGLRCLYLTYLQLLLSTLFRAKC